MPHQLKLDRDKCAQRNRIAARRDGVNAERVKFLREAGASARVTATKGWLPESEEKALERINAIRPNASRELAATDVWIHYVEAANDNFIGDRYMFMGARTLQNIAADAERGFAFMNSHRTGGLSSDAELPFGRTFCGLYEVHEDEHGPAQRAVIGFYMLRGVYPNGAGGPSTDDIHAAIDGGTIFDVSVGLWGGEFVCDVCGQDLYARDTEGAYVCPHVPGTHHSMSQGQIAAQEMRGVTKGRASYTLEDANCSETSAVYDGAVPGAGFNKALQFSRSMTAFNIAEARESFASLFGSTEVSMADQSKPGDPAAGDRSPDGFMAELRALFTKFFGVGGSRALEDERPAASSSPSTHYSLGSEHRCNVAVDGDRVSENITDVTCADCLRGELSSRTLAAEAQRAADAKAAEEREASERASRIDAEVTSFMGQYGSKMGLDLRTEFQHYYRGAKQGAVSLRTAKAGVAQDAPESARYEITKTASLSAEASEVVVGILESFARNLAPVGASERLEAGGPEIEQAARVAAGTAEPITDAEVGREAARRVKASGISERSADWNRAFTAEVAKVRAETGAASAV